MGVVLAGILVAAVGLAQEHADKTTFEIAKSCAITAHVGDLIVLQHRYFVVPRSIPASKVAASSDPCVKRLEISRVSYGVVGSAGIAAVFSADHPGHAILKLEVETQKTKQAVVCEVTVLSRKEPK